MKILLTMMIALMLIWNLAWAAGIDGFLGIKWGMSREEAEEIVMSKMQEKVKTGDLKARGQLEALERERKERKEGRRSTSYPNFLFFRDTIGDTAVRANILFKEDGFQGMLLYFEPSSYPKLVQAFTTRYGAPTTVKDSIVQNPAGAKFSQQDAFWKFDDATILISKYGDKLTEGRISVKTTSSLEAFRKREEDAAKKAIEDLK